MDRTRKLKLVCCMAAMIAVIIMGAVPAISASARDNVAPSSSAPGSPKLPAGDHIVTPTIYSSAAKPPSIYDADFGKPMARGDLESGQVGQMIVEDGALPGV